MKNGNGFLVKIIEQYLDAYNDFLKMELLKSNAIRELMEISKEKNPDFLQKLMPVILSLFQEGECFDPYSACTKDINELNKEEITQVNSILESNIEK
jgi:hypothetical protein